MIPRRLTTSTPLKEIVKEILKTREVTRFDHIYALHFIKCIKEANILLVKIPVVVPFSHQSKHPRSQRLIVFHLSTNSVHECPQHGVHLFLRLDVQIKNRVRMFLEGQVQLKECNSKFNPDWAVQLFLRVHQADKKRGQRLRA